MLKLTSNASTAHEYINQAKKGIDDFIALTHPNAPTLTDLVEVLEVLLLKILDTEKHIGVVKWTDGKGNPLHAGFDFKSDILGELKEQYFFNPHKTSNSPTYSPIIINIVTPILDRLMLLSHEAVIIVSKPLIDNMIEYAFQPVAKG